MSLWYYRNSEPKPIDWYSTVTLLLVPSSLQEDMEDVDDTDSSSSFVNDDNDDDSIDKFVSDRSRKRARKVNINDERGIEQGTGTGAGIDIDIGTASKKQKGNKKVYRYQYEHVVPLKPDELYVNWGNIFHTTKWGTEPILNNYLPVIEIDKLVGYATHITSHHYPRSDTRNSNNYSKQERHFNPLLGLPNIPLRPTLVQHLIQDPASKIIADHLAMQQQQRLDDNCDGDDDPDMIYYNTDIKKKRKVHYLYERFHHSAAIAIGMLVEEMITASLLPLARQYVQLCRQKEGQEQEVNWTLPPEEAIMKLYHANETTGMNSLNYDATSTTLLSSRVPTRSTVSGAIGTSILNQPKPGGREQIAYNNWWNSRLKHNQQLQQNTSHGKSSQSEHQAKIHDQQQRQWRNEKFIIENDPFFQFLIQNIPSTSPSSTSTSTSLSF